MELLEVARIKRGGIGRHHGEHGLHEAAHRRHHLRKFVVSLGVNARVAANFADGFGVVVHAPEVIAVGHGRKGAVERQNFETVSWKVELADDFRTQQGDYVRTFGKKKTGDDLFGNGGATENVAALEDQNFFAGLGQVGGVDQSVVTATDDDHVIMLRHFVKAPSHTSARYREKSDRKARVESIRAKNQKAFYWQRERRTSRAAMRLR